MNEFSTDATVERWIQEDDQFLAEVRELAKREAIDFANNPEFTESMRVEARNFNLDDFRKDGDIGLSTKLVVEHPTFGQTLTELLEVHRLIHSESEWLSDAAEAFVIVFFEFLEQSLGDFVGHSNTAG